MSERLTDEQLNELAGGEYGGSRQIAPLAAEVIALRARVARLEAALKPFAKEADTWSDRAPDDLHPFIDTFDAVHFGNDAEFTIGDLRAARAALKDAPQ